MTAAKASAAARVAGAATPGDVASRDAKRMVDFVPLFKALGNPTRAQITEFLLGGERCVCEMTGPLDVSQPLVSHHLALLRDAGLVGMRNEGSRTYYSIDRERFDADLTAFLDHVRSLRETRAATSDPHDRPTEGD